MITVHKYQLVISDDQLVHLPKNAWILKVAMQHGLLCLWAKVETSNPFIFRKIQIRGTGHNCERTGKYIDSFFMNEGELVFHVFDGGEQ